jgi:ribosomal protein L37AE/L43A
MTELKPCPFCGSADISRILTHSECTVKCRGCGASIHRGLYCGKYDTLREAEETFGRETNEAWNRRVKYDS